MSRFNTRNPLGSNDPRDLDDNAKNMDLAMNSDAQSWNDRLGKPRASMAGMESRFNDFIASSGYQFVGDYSAGIEIAEYNQIIRDSSGEFWRVSGSTSLPYTTTGSGVPEDGALVSVGDAAIRSELSDTESGASAVGYRGRTVFDALSETRSVDDFPGSDPTGELPSDDAFYAAFAWGNEDPSRTVYARGNYYLQGSTHIIRCNADLSDSTIRVNGEYESTTFILDINKKHVHFGIIEATGNFHLNNNGWSKNSTCVASKDGSNVADNYISFKRIANFRYGFSTSPSSGFFAYNTVRGDKIEDCMYNLHAYPSGSGWVNQNTYDIRTLRNNTSSVNGWALYFAKDIIQESPNGNLFLHICMEGIGPNAMLWKNSNGTFICPRFELRPNGSIVFDGDANYAHPTNIVFPDYLSESMFKFEGTARRPNIISGSGIGSSLNGPLESGDPSMGSTTVLAQWRHAPLPGESRGAAAVRVLPGKLQVMSRTETRPVVELDPLTGGRGGIRFPASGAAMIEQVQPSDGVSFEGPVNLGSSSLHAAYSGARIPAMRNGQQMWDRTLKIPIWWDNDDGTWRDSDGNPV